MSCMDEEQSLRKPPKWADRFLKWYCNPLLLEEIQGDAYELFYRNLEKNKAKAKWSFVWNVIRFCRWRNIRRCNPNQNNFNYSIDMLNNIFKVALRNFFRQPVHSLLNIVGLTVSFMAAFVIGLWVVYEYSFDKFHNEPDRIFQVLSHVEANGSLDTYMAAKPSMDITSIPQVDSKVIVINGTRWPNELCFRPEGKTNECIYLNGIFAEKSFFHR